MSLTSELKYNIELSSLIDNALLFKSKNIKKRENIKYDIKTDFKGSNTVGTAFDYLIRFELSKGETLNKINCLAVYTMNHLIQNNKILKYKEIYLYAYETINNYLLKKEKDIEKYLLSVIYFSFIDKIYRNHDFEDIDNIKSLKDIKEKYNSIFEDIKSLSLSLPNLNNIFKGKELILNPSFSNSSKLGGADADLIIDKTLIDIKTITVATITKDMLQQLIGYTVLANKDLIEIEKVGIYFSRYEHLEIFDINEIIKEKDLKKIKEYFEKKYKFI